MNIKDETYYQRQIILPEVGEAGQEKLKNTKVLVVGAGGLGCPVLDYLSRAGVGTIGIADGDKVSESNLHRQSLYGISDIGQLKVFVASKYILEVNPLINVKVHPQMISPENALKMITRYDIIMDCSDNYATRYLVNDACAILDKPLVYGAIYRFEGQVSVFNYQNGPTYRCLFPEFPSDDSNTNCAEAGVIGVLPGIIGLMQANEAIKMILGRGEVLSGKLLTYNAMTLNVNILRLTKDPSIDYSALSELGVMKHSFYTYSCETNVDIITHDELIDRIEGDNNLVLIDVRERNEIPLWEHEEIIKVPMSELETGRELIPKDRPLVIFCRSGQRSLKAVKELKSTTENTYIFSLDGGMTQELIDIWTSRKK